MKTLWILDPSPFKSARSINAVIYANVRLAQQHHDRPLTRQEIAKLIKAMKAKELFKSKQDNWALFNNFLANMKEHRLVQEKKPKA